MSRRLGLTRQAPSLLKMVNNRLRHPPKAAVAYDDPPLPEDYEDDETVSDGTLQAAKASDRAERPKRKVTLRRGPSPVDSDDSDFSADERMQRADIKSTKLTSIKEKKSKDGVDTKTTTTTKTIAKRRKLTESPEPIKTTTKLASGSHLKDKFGMISKRPARAKYGKRAVASSQSSQLGSSQGSTKKLRVPSSMESPQKKRSSKFILPGKHTLSSPGNSPRKLLTQMSGDVDFSDEDSIPSYLPSEPNVKRSKIGKKKADSSPAAPTRAVFKLPEVFASTAQQDQGGGAPYTGDEDLSKLSSDDEDGKGDTPTLRIPDVFDEPPAAKCPWCSEEVDKALLDDFAKGKRLNVRMQTRFCQLHKQHTAQQTWKDQNYPEIDWDVIEERFAVHRDFLLAIVNGRGSHFRNILAKDVEEGRSRAMKKDENLNPGYYGPRGFIAMCDYLVGEFGNTLKKRAVDDRVIAGRGSAAFIQAVLVAELGVRLIMEDMKLSESKARLVMEDSKELGELVQQETDR